ncbi:MAG: hypothetical protein ABIM74_03940 [candidate division WOR-3 bacterium]
MAINRRISRKRSFGDVYLELRVREDEPLLRVDRIAQETGLWRAVEREIGESLQLRRKAWFPSPSPFQVRNP